MTVRSATSLRAAVSFAIDDMVLRIEDLEAECLRLKRENETLWETVHELQDKRETA